MQTLFGDNRICSFSFVPGDVILTVDFRLTRHRDRERPSVNFYILHLDHRPRRRTQLMLYVTTRAFLCWYTVEQFVACVPVHTGQLGPAKRTAKT